MSEVYSGEAAKKFNALEYFRCLRMQCPQIRCTRADRDDAKECGMLCCCFIILLMVASGFAGFITYLAKDIANGPDGKCDRYTFCDYAISDNITCAVTYIDTRNMLETCYFALTESFTPADCARLSDNCIISRGNGECPISECDYDFAGEILGISVSSIILLIVLMILLLPLAAICVNMCKKSNNKSERVRNVLNYE